MSGGDHEPERPVSVVIVTRDRAGVISGCIESLENQLNDRDEIIIVAGDQKSFPDDLLERFSHLPIRRFFCLEPNICVARNIGLDESRAELVLFIDDDGLAHPCWINAYRALFSSDPSLWAAGGLVLDASRSPKLPEFDRGMIRPSGTQIEVVDQARSGTPRGYVVNIKGCNFALDRSRLPDSIRFDPFFAFGFDEADLAMNIHDQGGGIGFTRDAIVDHLHAPGLYRDRGPLERDWRTEFASHAMFMLKHSQGLGRLTGWGVVWRRVLKLTLRSAAHALRLRISPSRGLRIVSDAIGGVSHARRSHAQTRSDV